MIYRTCLNRFADLHKVFFLLPSFEFIVIQVLLCFILVALCFVNGWKLAMIQYMSEVLSLTFFCAEHFFCQEETGNEYNDADDPDCWVYNCTFSGATANAIFKYGVFIFVDQSLSTNKQTKQQTNSKAPFINDTNQLIGFVDKIRSDQKWESAKCVCYRVTYLLLMSVQVSVGLKGQIWLVSHVRDHAYSTLYCWYGLWYN